MTDFYFASFRFWLKFEKLLSQKEFLNEFWFIVRQHEYIYIAEMKVGNFYSWVILGAKTNFLKANNPNLR